MTEENADYIKKLSVIPKFELTPLLKSMYTNKSEKLSSEIKDLFGVKPREPFKKLEKLNSSQIIKLFSLQEKLPTKKIDELYDEWWQGQNPSLFFYEILRINDETLFKSTINRQLEKLNMSFNEINMDFTKEKASDFSDVRIINHKLVNNVLETEFEYQKRVDYIDPKTRNPAFVYSLTEGLIWVSKEQKAIIIKVEDASLLSHLSEKLRNLFNCDIIRFNLTKELVNEIFGFDTLKRALYVESEQQSDEYLEKKNVSDNRFANKREARDLDNRCDRPSSFHRLNVNEKSVSVSVNEKGKVRVYTNIKKSDLKDWAIETIKEIISKTAKFNKEDFKKYLGTRNLDDLPSLNILGNKSKDILRQISVALYKLKYEGKREHQIEFSIGDIYNNLKDYFYLIFLPICPDCNDISYLCKSCQALNQIMIFGTGMELKCLNCGSKIENITNDLSCVNDANHKFDDGKFDNVLAVGNKKLQNTINEINEYCNHKFKLENNEVMTIKGRTLSYNLINYKYEYLFNELMPFSKIISLEKIPNNIKQTQLTSLNEAGEKCVNFNTDIDCKNCMLNQKGLCISRLIAKFVDEPKLKAHSGYEFGDLSFKIKLDGKVETAVILAKSCKSRSENYKLTINNNDRLLQQVIKALMDMRISLIGIASSAIMDDNLKELIVLLVKRFGKRIFFIDREHIIRLTYDYLDKLSQPISSQNYWM